MQRITCSEIWGGVRNIEADVCSSTVRSAVYSRPCEGDHAGGDVYYISVCGYDILTRIALADVMGHGREVTDVSRWLYDALRTHMNSHEGQDVLRELNQLSSDFGYRAMTTAVVASFDRSESLLSLAYAGHPPLLARRRNDSEWRPMRLRSTQGLANLPLGVDPETVYDQQDVPFTSGDRIVLYSDGLVEARAADGELFGLPRLIDLLNQQPETDLPSLRSAVLRALGEFTSGPFDHDDVTLLAVEMC